jgi:hypothetical protein
MAGDGMTKQRIVLAAPAAEDRAAFRARVLASAAALAPGLDALSVCLVDATPAVPPWQRPGEPAPAAEPPFDAVVDCWGAEAALDHALHALAAARPGAAPIVAGVSETVEKDELPRPPGRAPGIKFLSLMCFQPDLQPAVARRLWSHHAALALRVHVGEGALAGLADAARGADCVDDPGLGHGNTFRMTGGAGAFSCRVLPSGRHQGELAGAGVLGAEVAPVDVDVTTTGTTSAAMECRL